MRKTNLDLIRVIAIMAVVFGHTIMLFWDFDPATPVWAVYNLLWLLVRGFLMLFFMISGTLFLSRDRLPFKKHMRRVGHMLLLFYGWSLVLNGIDTLFLHYWTDSGTFLTRFLGGYFHLWFLPTMALCYCVLPLLHGLRYGDRDNIRKGTVLLFAIVTVSTTLNAIPDKPAWLTAALAPYKLQQLQYFVIMPMGWQLYEHRLTGKKLGVLGIAAVLSCVLFAWLNRAYALRVGAASDVYYKDLSISAGLMGAFVYSLLLGVRALPARAAGVLKTLSTCTMGVYLLHPVLIDALRSRHWELSHYSALWLFPLCYCVFLLVPLGISWIMLKIPGLRNTIT